MSVKLKESITGTQLGFYVGQPGDLAVQVNPPDRTASRGWQPEAKAFAVALLNSGKTIKEVANACGVTKWKVKHLQAKVKAPRVKRGPTSRAADRQHEARSLWAGGFGTKYIAKNTGVPLTTVRRWRKGWPKPEKKRTAGDVGREFFKRYRRPKKFCEIKIQAQAFRIEQSAFSEADCPHWARHPVAVLHMCLRYQRIKAKTDPNFKLRRTLRSRIYNVLKGNKKSASTLRLLGCDLDTFRRYIEARFSRGMTWKNHGSVWHLDHIRPCASFDLRDLEQQRACFHYTNHQPLFAADNLRKSDTMPTHTPELIMSLNS